MIMQVVTIVRKPICPTFVHDETTRIIICTIGIIIGVFCIYKIMVYFNK